MSDEKMVLDDMNVLMKLSKLYAISRGRKNLLFEDYQYIKDLETERKNR